ncbi:replication initiation protein, RepL2 [Streptomyces sp. SR27]|uniref:replication initiation protein, RepL2 n=1 Tax=Streptomyces sp. SR27 TaxID=3076630 RepID=UPI00295B736D|nr:replication initiation protein, RepL2 [Streptomyces sp. SR27]MDV9190948.1 replication initiation protein, RepL2 [Streptomyces sp. SR27]
MNIECREEIIELLHRTSDLPPLQRILVLAYAAADQDDTGTVLETGIKIAEDIGMSAQLFSRVRRELISSGWLEEDAPSRIGNVRYYRLTEKATGDEPSNVIALRSA